MANFMKRKRPVSYKRSDLYNRPAIDDAGSINGPNQEITGTERVTQLGNTVLPTDGTITNMIDPRLTNEALIVAKLRAEVTGMPDDDSGAIAAAYGATAQGTATRAFKVASTAQGANTIAAGVASNTQGISTIAVGTASTAQGYDTTASGLASTSQGIATNALEIAALAEGIGTTATGLSAHAEGSYTTASGDTAHAEGFQTTASGFAAHAEGQDTTASGYASHAEGYTTTARGLAAHAEGNNAQAIADESHAEGINTMATSRGTHAEGYGTTARGFYSHSEGFETISNGNYAHAQGLSTTADGASSHAQGENTAAHGIASHAEGQLTTADGEASHAEGYGTTALGSFSHAEGLSSAAVGDYSHAEGYLTRAVGFASHAEGEATIATGDNAHAEGLSTDTANQEGAHIMGQYGDARFPYSWHLANGTDENNKSLAAVIRNDGQGIADQGWVTGNADFAEMFETLSGRNIPPGYFVALNDDKIRKASSDDDYILGVTSAAPGFLGDAEDLRWKGKYAKDEWGRIKYRKVVIHEKTDENGNITEPERMELRPVISPEWNSSEEYIPRSERPEWVPVALVGKVLVMDDGTCRSGGYCMPNDEGIATASRSGYRVLKRTGTRQILILMK